MTKHDDKTGNLAASAGLSRRSVISMVGGTLALAPFARPLTALAGIQVAQADDTAAIWQKLIADAKKEGKISIVASGNRNYTPVYNEFSRKFGIETIISYGGGREHSTRILAERKGGIYAVDVGHVGGNTVNRRLIPAGAVAPIAPLFELPEVKDSKQWHGDRHWYADAAQKYAFVHSADFSTAFTMFINTKLVSDADLAQLKSPYDLFRGKFKNNLVAYSPMEGQSGNSYFRYSLVPSYGMNWLKEMVTSKTVDFVARSKLIEDGLARGKYAIALFPVARPLDKMERQGLPVKRVNHEFEKADGVMTGGATAQLVQTYDRAPHPAAAKLFVNWLLSREGQLFVHDNLKGGPDPRNSLRKDVPKTNVDPATVPKPGVNYYAIDLLPEYQKQRKTVMKQVQDWYKETYK